MLANVLTGVGILASIISITVGILALLEWRRSRRIERIEEFPMDISRAISFSDYVRALNRYEKLLKSRRAHPDVVVGIHYGGIASAADVARRFYGPLLRIEIKFRDDNGVPRCERVIPHFDDLQIHKKNVLLVDNRIKSGKTLEMSRDELLKRGAASVRTLVIFKPGGSLGRSDDVLFVAKRNLRHLIR